MCGLIDETRLQLQGNSLYTLITPPWLKGRCVVWEKKIQTHNLDNCNINEVIKQMQKKKDKQADLRWQGPPNMNIFF